MPLQQGSLVIFLIVFDRNTALLHKGIKQNDQFMICLRLLKEKNEASETYDLTWSLKDKSTKMKTCLPLTHTPSPVSSQLSHPSV